MNKVKVRVDNVIEDYMAGGDYAYENANTHIGPSGLLLAVGGRGLRDHNLAMLKEQGFGDLVDMHKKGGVHIHDLSLGVYTPYCGAYSLPILLNEGMSLDVNCKPSRHFASAINHMVNWIGTVSNAFSGAAAFNSVDTLLAPYAYKCYLDAKSKGCSKNIAFKIAREEIYQNIQSFIYHLNFTTRFGDQAPFSNITLDVTVPDDMKDQIALVGGKPLIEYYDYTKDGIKVNHRTYSELWEWQRLVAEAILDTMIEGDGEKSFTFPVLTINVTEDLFKHPLMDRICELTRKFGTPFFSNFINGEVGRKKPNMSDSRALCCRLNLDLAKIATHTGGTFGGNDGTGSLQVITISLPYHAMRVKSLPIEQRFDAFKGILKDLIEDIAREQRWKRDVVTERFDKGFFPVSRKQLRHGFDSFFTTVGFIGLFECVQALTGDDEGFLTDSGLDLAEAILIFMDDEVKACSAKHKMLMNVESSPAESAAYKLAKKGLKQFPDMPFRGTKKAPYLTNSHHLPVEYQNQLDLVFKTQTRLQRIPTGGCTQHFTVGEKMTVEDVRNFVWQVCHTTINYFSVNTVFACCPICGYIGGYNETCPNEHTAEQIEELRKTKPWMIEE